eukprot:8613646-Pyramimonas_sp.AAC.1
MAATSPCKILRCARRSTVGSSEVWPSLGMAICVQSSPLMLVIPLLAMICWRTAAYRGRSVMKTISWRSAGSAGELAGGLLGDDPGPASASGRTGDVSRRGSGVTSHG